MQQLVHSISISYEFYYQMANQYALVIKIRLRLHKGGSPHCASPYTNNIMYLMCNIVFVYPIMDIQHTLS